MVSILIDEQLLLRSYTPDDAPALFQAIDHNRAHLRPWLAWVDATTRPEHSAAFIEQSLVQLNQEEGIALGIFHQEQIVGGLGMLEWNHQLKQAQVGYWIAKDHEGSGMLSRCLQRFIDFLFSRVGLNKIEVRFVAANRKSAAVAQRFGAKTEGILRDSYFANGKYEDLVVTGILKREWQGSRQSAS